MLEGDDRRDAGSITTIPEGLVRIDYWRRTGVHRVRMVTMASLPGVLRRLWLGRYEAQAHRQVDGRLEVVGQVIAGEGGRLEY